MHPKYFTILCALLYSPILIVLNIFLRGFFLSARNIFSYISDVYGYTEEKGWGSIEREWWYKKIERKNTEAIEMGGGTVVGRPRLICKWKGTEIEFYVRIELAIFFSQIAARREEVVAADEREISTFNERWTAGHVHMAPAVFKVRWMFPTTPGVDLWHVTRRLIRLPLRLRRRILFL